MRTRSQRLLSMVLALSMLLTFLPVSAFADDTPPPHVVSNEDAPTLDENNTCTDNGNTYTYELNTANNTATLTKFTGPNADVPSIVTARDGQPYTVTAIGENAFANYHEVPETADSPAHLEYNSNDQLTSVNLPDTITDIGDHAFYYCTNTNFTSITIPDGVTKIKEGTFGYCTSLKNVTLPNSITSIGVGAFSVCSALTSITLPEGLNKIEDYAFSYAGLTEVNLPNSITSIGEGAFSACSALTSITLPEGLNKIEDYAFAAAGLTEVNLPNSITSIGVGAFSVCSALTSITLPDNLTEVKDYAFQGANLETIDWPVSLTSVGTSAFENQKDYTIDPPSIIVSINTITYHGTKAQWDEMAGPQNFATTNPQLVPKDTEHPNGVDLRCAHTVTFNKNGHGDPKDQVVQYEGYVDTSKVDAPTADGYKFMGWYTESEGGEAFDFGTKITKDTELFAHWKEEEKKPDTQEKPNEPNPPQNPDDNKPGTPEKPNDPTPPEVPAVEEDDTAAIGYAAAAVTAAFVGWGAYRIGSEVYLKYLLPKDVLLPQNRIQLAELLWEDAGRPAPADAAPYADVDANDTDARQAARWAVENGLLTLPDTEKPEEFVPYRSVSYAKSARAWNKAQQLKENAAR